MSKVNFFIDINFSGSTALTATDAGLRVGRSGGTNAQILWDNSETRWAIDNAAGSNVVVIDFDGDTTLARFWQTDTARAWCAATYTSFSHSEQEHRFRAIFPLERELRSTAEHRGAYWLIVNR